MNREKDLQRALHLIALSGSPFEEEGRTSAYLAFHIGCYNRDPSGADAIAKQKAARNR